jgi:uncharacterized lipoprotein YajG
MVYCAKKLAVTVACDEPVVTVAVALFMLAIVAAPPVTAQFTNRYPFAGVADMLTVVSAGIFCTLVGATLPPDAGLGLTVSV